LEPGEAYEKTLKWRLLNGKPNEKVSFKMGFTPIGSKQTYWSNEVTVQVEPAAETGTKPKDAEGDTANPLTVTATPQPHVWLNDPFKVAVRVVNTSKSTQSFGVMDAAWYIHWKTDTDRVSCWEGLPPSQGNFITHKLEPGKAYEKTLKLLIHSAKVNEKVSFKMGFTPAGNKQTYWSNEITVQVEPDYSAPPPEANKTKTKLWAGISVSQPVFVGKNDTVPGIFQINFTMINDGDKTIDPEISSSKLLINGKELKDWPILVSNGPKDNRFKALPPGDYLLFGSGLGKYFEEPGIYKVSWQGKAFQSNEIEFRVLPEKGK
jgi:hypothetical protein